MLPDWFTVAEVCAWVGALAHSRSRPAVALRVRLRASPSAQDDTEGEMRCRGWCARRLEIPTCGRPPGSTPGCRPPLRMTREAGMGTQSFTVAEVWHGVCALDDWRSRPAVALTGSTPGCCPPLRMTRGGIVWQRKLEFTLGFRRYFFSFKLIKKPSPVGEGGPR